MSMSERASVHGSNERLPAVAPRGTFLAAERRNHPAGRFWVGLEAPPAPASRRLRLSVEDFPTFGSYVKNNVANKLQD